MTGADSIADRPGKQNASTGTPDFCFVMARPRSGTTVFKRMLETHPLVVGLGEIFTETNEGSYFHFLRELVASDPDALLPSRSAGVFLRYLESCRKYALQKKSGCKIVVLDVKYDQAHLLCEPWWRLGGLPRLLFLIREKKWKVIDIHRRDVVRLSVSNHVAIQTKIYHSHSLAPGESQTASVHIEPKALVWEVEMTRKSYASMARHFAGRDAYKLIYYEDMFADADGASFSGRLTREIARFLGVEDAFDPNPKLQKLLSGDMYAYIENSDEIRSIVERESAKVS